MSDQPGLFDFRPPHQRPPELAPGLSRTQRKTAENAAWLARGVHPATRADLRPDGGTCGGCAHHHAYQDGRYDRTYHKCDRHRLGESHSDASDIRVGWPACALYEPAS